MKTTYLPPQLEVLDTIFCSIIATSNVNIEVNSEEYEGEGRAKEDPFEFEWE